MNKTVNKKLAILLKEKGFNEVCQYRYNEKGDLNSTKLGMHGKPNDYSNNYSAPTIAEVVMWLYEKYGIWVIVDCDCYGELWYARLSAASKENWDDLDKRHEIISAVRKFPNEHKLPTEAYEAAIEYLLKNLIK